MEIYEKLSLKKVINASGKMSILGVSKVSDAVLEAQKFGAQHFFEMSELTKKVGLHIANLLGTENAVVVSSASAGIAQCVSAVIGMGDAYHLMHPYTDRIKKREIVLPKGHNVNYGSSIELMIEIGGGKVIEAGYANECTKEQVEMCITENTAALFYVKSHHSVQKGMLSIEAMQELSQQYKIPLILDAAAEEDLSLYYDKGPSLVIYSGAKALEGPSSGLILGRNPYVEYVQRQSKGLGRSMKVGKESILGLLAAIETYIVSDKESGEAQKIRLKPFILSLNEIVGLSASVVQDGAGREIFRAQLNIDKGIITAFEVIEALKCGEVAVYTREYQANDNIIEFDIRAVNENEMNIITSKLKNIMEGTDAKNSKLL